MLSGASHPGGAGFKNSISLDQFAAEQLGPMTRFSSFVLDVNADLGRGRSSAVRDVERQLQLGQEWERKAKPIPSELAPTDITENKKLIDKIRLMLDVARLGFESGSTRVVSLFVNTFSVVADLPGVKDETHSITHHGGRKEALDQLFIIDECSVQSPVGISDRPQRNPGRRLATA